MSQFPIWFIEPIVQVGAWFTEFLLELIQMWESENRCRVVMARSDGE